MREIARSRVSGSGVNLTVHVPKSAATYLRLKGGEEIVFSVEDEHDHLVVSKARLGPDPVEVVA